MNDNNTKVPHIFVSNAEAEELHLPNETKEMLTQIGLPGEAPLGVSFKRINQEALFKAREDSEEFYAIGSDGGSVISLKRDGTVVSVDESGKELRFVNSKLSYFVLMLDMYSSYAETVQKLNDIEGEAFAIQVATNMKSVDPAAFIDPDDWWPSVTQQMKFGML